MTFAERLFLGTALLLLGALFSPTRPVQAQALEPRFGMGFNGMLSTADGLGLGIRGRASAPMNVDLSFAVDVGMTGFILKGRDEATYVFDPQVSVIITLPYGDRRAPYILAGVGAYIPFAEEEDDDENEGGPTLHGGIGWVQTLHETTIFYELDPALVVGRESVDIVIPVRLGVIF